MSATETPCGISFTDVPPGYLFYSDIEFLACRGIVNGVGNGLYLPGNFTTRGQFAKIVTIAFSVPSFTPSSGQTFSDVPPSNFFYPYVEAAAHSGYLFGYANGSFRPDLRINRVETAVVIQRVRNYPAFIPATPSFLDIQPGDFGYVDVETLVHEGIINGGRCASGNGLCFRRNDFIRRDEMAKIVRRSIETLP